jgi:hypothetical protein
VAKHEGLPINQQRSLPTLLLVPRMNYIKRILFCPLVLVVNIDAASAETAKSTDEILRISCNT